MSPVSASAPATLQSYYTILTSGADAYGEGADLRPLLSAHLKFSSAIAGHHLEATEGFLRGVAGFIGTVRSIDVLSEVQFLAQDTSSRRTTPRACRRDADSPASADSWRSRNIGVLLLCC